jgi:hypothetical protein
MAGYSGTPLPKKLCIREGARVALVNAPPDFESVLGALPEGANVSERRREPPVARQKNNMSPEGATEGRRNVVNVCLARRPSGAP